MRALVVMLTADPKKPQPPRSLRRYCVDAADLQRPTCPTLPPGVFRGISWRKFSKNIAAGSRGGWGARVLRNLLTLGCPLSASRKMRDWIVGRRFRLGGTKGQTTSPPHAPPTPHGIQSPPSREVLATKFREGPPPKGLAAHSPARLLAGECNLPRANSTRGFVRAPESAICNLQFAFFNSPFKLCDLFPIAPSPSLRRRPSRRAGSARQSFSVLVVLLAVTGCDQQSVRRPEPKGPAAT